MTRIRVGITVGLRHSQESIWSNGIKQNAIFLALALRHCPQVKDVVLINTTDVELTGPLPWDCQEFQTLQFDEEKYNIDLLIELGGQIDAEQTGFLKQRGVRLISYCCGCEYISTMESILFRKPLWGTGLFVNQRYDAVWMIPQIENISRQYFEVLRRQHATVVPFVWSPMLIEKSSRSFDGAGTYQVRRRTQFRLSVMEPNINVVKFCLYPIFIAELAFRRCPDEIEILQVTNTQPFVSESAEFISLMNQLDIVRERRAVFLGRYNTPEFLTAHTDIVISHQWENPLNYLYLETCWQGYPLVHNASLCPDIGYYYHGNDLESAAQRVLEVMAIHDAQALSYREDQRKRISRFLPDTPTVVAEYTALLEDVLRRDIR